MKLFKAYVSIILLLTLLSIRLYGQKQGQAYIDSLLKELISDRYRYKEDTNKVNLLNDLSHKYYRIGEQDNGIKYGEQGLEMANKLNYKNGIAKAHNVLGANNLSRSDYQKALQHFHAALKLYEELGNKSKMATVTMNIGNLFAIEGNYTQALEYFIKAMNMAEEAGDKNMAANIGSNIGGIYSDRQNYTKAEEYLFKSLKIYRELGAGHKIEEANVLLNMGVMYQSWRDYSKAQEYNFSALKLAEELGARENVANITGNMALVYTMQKNYIKAIESAQRSFQISQEINNKRLTAWALYETGDAYLCLYENVTEGKSSVTMTGEVPTKKYRQGSSAVFIPAGKAARLNLALAYLLRALDSAKKIQVLDVMQPCYKDIARAYTLRGDYKKALEASGNYHSLKDSIFSKENSDKIVRMGVEGEYRSERLADSFKAAEKMKIANINLKKQKSYTYMSIAGILLLAGFSFFIVRERGRSERQRKMAEQERKKSDDLLLNILPAEVAHELKINGKTTARHFENVTVLFTDFVNFTNAGERMTPQELVDELHTCFKAFDEITGKYNIEKVKTVGDAYLAVAGLPVADAKHAENAVRAAIEINAFMNDRLAKLGERTFAIRIGIHSGSAVAGVVGVKKFAYDIWGDTVNTAARMEQNSEAGKINISETTCELVKEKFICEYRGEIKAKNKGIMKMYFIS